MPHTPLDHDVEGYGDRRDVSLHFVRVSRPLENNVNFAASLANWDGANRMGVEFCLASAIVCHMSKGCFVLRPQYVFSMSLAGTALTSCFPRSYTKTLSFAIAVLGRWFSLGNLFGLFAPRRRVSI